MSCIPDNIIINYYTFMSCSVLSAMSSIFIIVTCMKKKLYEGFAFRIVMLMAINDLIRCFIYMIPIYMIKSNEICKPLAYIVSVAFLSNISWAACISVTLYQVLISQIHNYEVYQKYWLVLNFVVIPAVEALPFIHDSYGYTNGLCSFKPGLTSNIWRSFVIYVPAWIFMVISLFIFIRLYWKVEKIQTAPAKSIIVDRGYIYTIITAFVLIPLTLLRILGFFLSGCTIEVVGLFSYALFSLHGFLNFLAFSANKTVKIALISKRDDVVYLNAKDYLTGSSKNSHNGSINSINMWGW